MKTKNFFWGMILVIIGVMTLCNNVLDINLFHMESLWPCFILIPGLSFEIEYFTSRRNPGVLVPGGILTTIGALFLFENATGWKFSEHTWPIYPLAVAIGLFQLYLFGGKNRGLLIPVGILTAVSAISFVSMLFGELAIEGMVVPIILIILGVWIIFKGHNK